MIVTNVRVCLNILHHCSSLFRGYRTHDCQPFVFRILQGPKDVANIHRLEFLNILQESSNLSKVFPTVPTRSHNISQLFMKCMCFSIVFNVLSTCIMWQETFTCQLLHLLGPGVEASLKPAEIGPIAAKYCKMLWKCYEHAVITLSLVWYLSLILQNLALFLKLSSWAFWVWGLDLKFQQNGKEIMESLRISALKTAKLLKPDLNHLKPHLKPHLSVLESCAWPPEHHCRAMSSHLSKLAIVAIVCRFLRWSETSRPCANNIKQYQTMSKHLLKCLKFGYAWIKRLRRQDVTGFYGLRPWPKAPNISMAGRAGPPQPGHTCPHRIKCIQTS